MKLTKPRNKERGVALLLAIVALLLITAAGLALMFSADTETAISVNYRDKQVAIYGALAGLEEARNRIHPVKGDLGAKGSKVVPVALPPNDASVLYIINPASGETVAPWDPSNEYFDTELCQEDIPGVTKGAYGVPCPKASSSVPAGTAWYHVEDAWSPGTLSYKWVRITLKHSSMTPVQVGTSPKTQVCWINNHQELITSGYDTACAPKSGGLTAINVLDPGTNYTSVPSVTITGGSGSGAEAKAILGPVSGVTSVELTDGGLGYTSPPAVSVVPVDGLGSGAEVAATIASSRSVQSVSVDHSGTPGCYPTGTDPAGIAVNFNPNSDPGSTAAKGTVALYAGHRCILGIQLNKSSSTQCGASNTTYSITGSNGFKATFSTNSNNKKPSGTYSIVNPGNGDYSSASLTADPGCPDVTASVTSWGTQIEFVNVTSGGAYTNTPAVSFNGTKPSFGTTSATATLSGAQDPSPVKSLFIVQGMHGSGYDVNPNLVISAPPAVAGNSTAQGKAYITPTDGVVGIEVTNPGTGYTPGNPPTVTISAPTGGGVTALANAVVGTGGDAKGAVYLLTALAQTSTGARAMAQMEVGVTFATYPLSLGGAMTLAGPNPSFASPKSEQFFMDGTDHAGSGSTHPSGCNGTAGSSLPAIGVYDDPSNPPPEGQDTAQTAVIEALGKPNNYVGAGTAPDVENAFGMLAGATPDTLNSVVASVASPEVATNVYGSPTSEVTVSNINMGSAENPAYDVVYGNYTMSGNQTGYGLLVVTGQLTFSGDFAWNGVIMVIGDGAAILNGGGNAQINGAVFVANTSGSTLGSPSVAFSGGGGNGIYYDHCWADDLLKRVNWVPVPSPNALQVISLRMLDL